MHTGYTLIQPYVFLTLNSLLTNEHLLSSPADLFCYEFSGDVSLKFVASPYTELIIGQRPDGSGGSHGLWQDHGGQLVPGRTEPRGERPCGAGQHLLREPAGLLEKPAERLCGGGPDRAGRL